MGTVIYITSEGQRIELEAAPGITVMQLATVHGVPGIEAECGGSLSCATCHVYVDDDWYGRTGPPGETERDMLTFAEDPQTMSRLSCQIRYRDELDGLIVRIPERQ